MPDAVQDALGHLNLLTDEGWEYPDAFDRAGTRLGTKGLKQLREAYDSQEYPSLGDLFAEADRIMAKPIYQTAA
jgi:hypothetical protein